MRTAPTSGSCRVVRSVARLIRTPRGIEIRCPGHRDGHLLAIVVAPDRLEIKCRNELVLVEVEKANAALAKQAE